MDGSGFVSEVQSLVVSFNQNVDQQLSRFPHIDTMLKLQGQQVVANVASLNQQSTVGLISADVLPTEAGAAINTLTKGPDLLLADPVQRVRHDHPDVRDQPRRAGQFAQLHGLSAACPE